MPADTAYRGYLIRTSPFRGDVWIELDGFFICNAFTVTHAKHIIDTRLASEEK